MAFLIGVIAFVSEYADSSLGMGYGTVLSPVLLLMGYPASKVVPAILASQFVTDVAACLFHHRCRNVNLKIHSMDFKIALVLGLVSCAGVLFSVVVVLKIPTAILTLYIGALVFCMGALILLTTKKNIFFSWPKILGLSFLAAFNKGVSGGGYGPLVMGGQILSGVHAKNAVGITAFAEALTCLLGFLLYCLLGKAMDWGLIALLVASAVLAVPFAALTVKNFDQGLLKRVVGVTICCLGALMLSKVFFSN
ncbi:MAG: sulfite exporter TauE/SafE family protein [Candidatus Omnitrophota bacterium]